MDVLKRTMQILAGGAVQAGREYFDNAYQLKTDAAELQAVVIGAAKTPIEVFRKIRNQPGGVLRKINNWFYQRSSEFDESALGGSADDDFDPGFSDTGDTDEEESSPSIDVKSMKNIARGQVGAMYQIGGKQVEASMANTAEIVSTVNSRTMEITTSINNLNKTLLSLNGKIDRIVESLSGGSGGKKDQDRDISSGIMDSSGGVTLGTFSAELSKRVKEHTITQSASMILDSFKNGQMTPESLASIGIQLLLDEIKVGDKSVGEWATKINDTIGAYTQEIFTNLAKKGPLKFLFGNMTETYRPDYSSYVKNTYTKEKAVFDGMTRKTIIDIIPGYLREITHALTGIRYNVDSKGRLTQKDEDVFLETTKKGTTKFSAITWDANDRIEKKMKEMDANYDKKDLRVIKELLTSGYIFAAYFSGETSFTVSEMLPGSDLGNEAINLAWRSYEATYPGKRDRTAFENICNMILVQQLGGDKAESYAFIREIQSRAQGLHENHIRLAQSDRGDVSRKLTRRDAEKAMTQAVSERNRQEEIVLSEADSKDIEREVQRRESSLKFDQKFRDYKKAKRDSGMTPDEIKQKFLESIRDALTEERKREVMREESHIANFDSTEFKGKSVGSVVSEILDILKNKSINVNVINDPLKVKIDADPQPQQLLILPPGVNANANGDIGMNLGLRGCGPIALSDMFNRRNGLDTKSLARSMMKAGRYDPYGGTSIGGYMSSANDLGMPLYPGQVNQDMFNSASPRNPITLLGSGETFRTKPGNLHFMNLIGKSGSSAYVSNPMYGGIHKYSIGSIKNDSILGLRGFGDDDDGLSDVINTASESLTTGIDNMRDLIIKLAQERGSDPNSLLGALVNSMGLTEEDIIRGAEITKTHTSRKLGMVGQLGGYIRGKGRRLSDAVGNELSAFSADFKQKLNDHGFNKRNQREIAKLGEEYSDTVTKNVENKAKSGEISQRDQEYAKEALALMQAALADGDGIPDMSAINKVINRITDRELRSDLFMNIRRLIQASQRKVENPAKSKLGKILFWGLRLVKKFVTPVFRVIKNGFMFITGILKKHGTKILKFFAKPIAWGAGMAVSGVQDIAHGLFGEKKRRRVLDKYGNNTDEYETYREDGIYQKFGKYVRDVGKVGAAAIKGSKAYQFLTGIPGAMGEGARGLLGTNIISRRLGMGWDDASYMGSMLWKAISGPIANGIKSIPSMFTAVGREELRKKRKDQRKVLKDAFGEDGDKFGKAGQWVKDKWQTFKDNTLLTRFKNSQFAKDFSASFKESLRQGAAKGNAYSAKVLGMIDKSFGKKKSETLTDDNTTSILQMFKSRVTPDGKVEGEENIFTDIGAKVQEIIGIKKQENEDLKKREEERKREEAEKERQEKEESRENKSATDSKEESNDSKDYEKKEEEEGDKISAYGSKNGNAAESKEYNDSQTSKLSAEKMSNDSSSIADFKFSDSVKTVDSSYGGSNAGNDFKETISPEAAAKAASKQTKSISSITSAAKSNGKAGISGVLGALGKGGLKGALTGMTSKLLSGLGGPLGKIAGGVIKIVGGVASAVASLKGVQMIRKAIQKMFKQIAQPLASTAMKLYAIVKPITKLIRDLFKIITKTIAKPLNLIFDVISKLLSVVIPPITKIVGFVGDLVSTFVNTFLKLIMVPIKKLLDIALPIIKTIGAVVKTILGIAQSIFGVVQMGLGRVIQAIGTFAGALSFGFLGKSIKTFGEGMAEEGKANVTAGIATAKEGFAEGITAILSVGSDSSQMQEENNKTTENRFAKGTGSSVIDGTVINNNYTTNTVDESTVNNTYGNGDTQYNYGSYLGMRDHGCGPVALADAYNRRTGGGVNAASLASAMAGSGNYSSSRGTSVGSFINSGNALGLGMKAGGVTSASISRATPNNPITVVGSGGAFGTRSGNTHYMNVVGSDGHGHAYVSNPMKRGVTRVSTNDIVNNSIAGIYGSGDTFADSSDILTMSEQYGIPDKIADLIDGLKTLAAEFLSPFGGEKSVDTELKKANTAATLDTAKTQLGAEKYSELEKQAYEQFKKDYPKLSTENDTSYEGRWKRQKDKYMTQAVAKALKEKGETATVNNKQILDALGKDEAAKVFSETVTDDKIDEAANEYESKFGTSQIANSIASSGSFTGPLQAGTGVALNFTPRLTKPEVGNKYYNNPSAGGYNTIGASLPTRDAGLNELPNCAGYALGRFHEEIGDPSFKYFQRKYGSRNGGLWVENAKAAGNLAVDTTGADPHPGDAISWAGGGQGGHVAIVEQVPDPNTIVISHSAYGGFKSGDRSFQTKEISRGNASDPWKIWSSYRFKGFIHNPEIQMGAANGGSGGSVVSSDGTPEGTTYAYLVAGKGMTPIAAAGAMGCMKYESNFQSNNLENKFQSAFGYGSGVDGDAKYTAAVNSGQETENQFVTGRGRVDKVGYGLTQFTSSNLKQALYNNTVKRGKSIDDIPSQLDCVVDTLKSSKYNGDSLFNKMNQMTTPTDANKLFLWRYEAGTSYQSDEAVAKQYPWMGMKGINDRHNAAEGYYQKYGSTTPSLISTGNDYVYGTYGSDYFTYDTETLESSGATSNSGSEKSSKSTSSSSVSATINTDLGKYQTTGDTSGWNDAKFNAFNSAHPDSVVVYLWEGDKQVRKIFYDFETTGLRNHINSMYNKNKTSSSSSSKSSSKSSSSSTSGTVSSTGKTTTTTTTGIDYDKWKENALDVTDGFYFRPVDKPAETRTLNKSSLKKNSPSYVYNKISDAIKAMKWGQSHNKEAEARDDHKSPFHPGVYKDAAPYNRYGGIYTFRKLLDSYGKGDEPSIDIPPLDESKLESYFGSSVDVPTFNDTNLADYFMSNPVQSQQQTPNNQYYIVRDNGDGVRDRLDDLLTHTFNVRSESMESILTEMLNELKKRNESRGMSNASSPTPQQLFDNNNIPSGIQRLIHG